MNSTERVRAAILGQPFDRQPVYGWVRENLREELTRAYGSPEAFEDLYQFDAAHIFGGPGPHRREIAEQLREKWGELTPEMLLESDVFTDPHREEDYAGMRESIRFHKKRERFCYVQTPGFFEAMNGLFTIEEQLLQLALDPVGIGELYERQLEWTLGFIPHAVDAGADMIHISDDWGSQKDLLFSPRLWWELIFPRLKRAVSAAHEAGALASLHSDGCVMKVLPGIAEAGFDCIHPFQESAGMDYGVWLREYSDKFAILGGLCIQTELGRLSRPALQERIRRVFSLLGGRRWVVCTTHFVQNHCSVEDLAFAYDLVRELAEEYGTNR